MSDNHSSLLDRIRRARNISSYAFAVVLLGVIGCAVLRDLGHLTPAVYGLALALLTITALAAVGLWCTVYVCEWDARNAKRAERIGERMDQLSEVVMVTEYLVAMEDEKHQRTQRSRRINRD